VFRAQKTSSATPRPDLALGWKWSYGGTTSSSYTGVSHPQVVVPGHNFPTGIPQPDPQRGALQGLRLPAVLGIREEAAAVHCPFCRHGDSRVVDSRTAEDGTAIRRRRQCPECDRRFTTVEQVTLAVVKSSGATEPFSRDKVISGVRKACQGRPVDEADLARLGQQVEDRIRATGSAEVPSHEVGLAILGPLRELDEVAYLRFASVYRGFDSLADFEAEIAKLRADRGQLEHLS
jgi:transcriptional repressor NrdR